MSETPSNPSAEEVENEQPAREAKGKSKKTLFAIIGAVVLLAAGGFFAWEKNFLPFLPAAKTQAAHNGKGQSAGGFLERSLQLGIPAATANLDTGNGRTIYVKMTARVEIEGAKDATSLQGRVPEIQDIFQTYLHETRPEDLHGSGFYRLREALLRRLRADLAPLKVSNIYITELLTQ